MANPTSVLSGAPRKEITKDVPCTGIKELVCRTFTTRNLVHFAHWKTNSYAQHIALNELYDEILDKVDEIVEVYQGKFGVIDGLQTMKASVPKDMLKHVEDEAAWISNNKDQISMECEAVENLLDELDAGYLKVIYKLTNLK